MRHRMHTWEQMKGSTSEWSYMGPKAINECVGFQTLDKMGFVSDSDAAMCWL